MYEKRLAALMICIVTVVLILVALVSFQERTLNIAYSASYIIDVQGSTYRMRNGTTGQIDFQSSDASAVINNAIGNLTRGGEILLRAGLYVISSSIRVTSCVTIEGESLGVQGNGTYLTLDDAANCDMFKILNATSHDYFATLRYMMLCGNSAFQTGTSNAINITGTTSDISISNLYINDFLNDSIHIERRDPAGSYYVWIHNNWLEFNDGAGINITGISGYAMRSVFISDNIIVDNLYGIWTNQAAYVSIEQNHVYNNKKNGIYFSTTSWSQIVNNFIYQNSQAATNTYDDIYVTGGSYTNIENNILSGTTASTKSRYSVYLNYTRGVVNVQGNTFYAGTGTGALYHAGSATAMIKNNVGFITENSGSTASCVNGTWIAHGLGGRPTNIQLTLDGSQVINSTAWYLPPSIFDNANSTMFQICFYYETSSGIYPVSSREEAAAPITVSWSATYTP